MLSLLQFQRMAESWKVGQYQWSLRRMTTHLSWTKRRWRASCLIRACATRRLSFYRWPGPSARESPSCLTSSSDTSTDRWVNDWVVAPSGCESRTGHGSMLFFVFSTQFLVYNWREAEMPYCLSTSVLSYIKYPSFSNNLHFWTNSCHFIERQKSPVVKPILFLFSIIQFFMNFIWLHFLLKVAT